MPISQKIIDQYNLLKKSMPNLQAHPADWLERGEDYEYLYREDTLLARDADAPAVAEFLRGPADLRELVLDSADDEDSVGRLRDGAALDSRVFLAEHPIEGLTRWRMAGVRSADGGGSVPDMLAQEAAGNLAEMATPEAVLHICGNCCPADEPGSVSQQTEKPIPPVAADCGCEPRCNGKGVSVRVVDTGWIPAAAQRSWLKDVKGDVEASYVEGTEDVIRDYAGHGTFTAGCVRVVAPKATIYVDGTMTVVGAQYEGDLVRQLAEALTKETDAVVVMPFTTTSPNLTTLVGFDRLYENLLRQKIEEGMVIISSAGCDDTDAPTWPAKYDWVVSVGALEPWEDGKEPVKAHFSNYGPHVDVYVVGEGLVNAYATGTFFCEESPNKGVQRDFYGMAQWSGTSFATALFGGMVAARKSHTGEKAREAAQALLNLAESQHVDGIGPVLRLEQACAAVAERTRAG